MKKLGYALGLSMMLATAQANADDAFSDALSKSKPLLDMRARWEDVGQDGLPKTADAVTLRTRFGFETGDYEHFKVLVEAQDVRDLARDAFNNTFNGRTKFPTVGDGKGISLDRAQITYTGLPQTTVIVGRQRILLDNQRFVGNAGFRQREQTFDAATVINKTVPNLELQYSYLGQVLRVFGPNSPQGHFDSESHLLHASYTGIKNLTLTAYDYLLDLGPASTLNIKTAGARAVGDIPISGWVIFSYTAEFANQRNYRDNPRQIDLDYYLGEGSLKYKSALVGVGYEVLEGDNVNAFQTPLATLFAFNGWDDAFLTTPKQGLEDLYVKAGYIVSKVPVLNKVNMQVIYHKFSPNFGTGSFGREWDALAAVTLTPHWSVEARYADLSGGLGVAGRTKFWLSATYKL